MAFSEVRCGARRPAKYRADDFERRLAGVSEILQLSD